MSFGSPIDWVARCAISSTPWPNSKGATSVFAVCKENIDTTSPGGKLTFHIFSALAEFERDLIRQRTLAGLVAARARGRAERRHLAGGTAHNLHGPAGLDHMLRRLEAAITAV